ncbi:MAG: sensor histidine kinase [Anaerolineales bacterium]|nr:sensor histidine kinase [Anaerolineales bacterium]
MEQNSSKAAFISYPFYIFISLLIGVIAVIGIRDLWKSSSLTYTALFSFLILLHIMLFWLNIRQYENSRWWFFYYPAQVVLIVAMVNLPFASDINLTLLGSSILCLIGESLGLWGNTRRALYLGIFLFMFMVVMLYLQVGRDRLLLAVSSMLVNGGFIVLLMVMFNQQLAERQKAEELAESLESANAKLAASSAKIESLTLQNERQRMARELHDTLAQGVAGLVLQLEAVKAHLRANRTERASAIVEQSIIRARSTLAESRAAIDDLRAAPANLTEAVREKIDRFTQATGIPCELEISVNKNRLSPETTSHALNILSESLTNIARHAQATQVHVKWMLQDQNLELEVRDNGKGFDVNQKSNGSYGLVGMHERARLTGGTLSIESNNDGTCIQFIVGRS